MHLNTFVFKGRGVVFSKTFQIRWKLLCWSVAHSLSAGEDCLQAL